MSAQRLLPPGWRGSGRRAVWRRARLRRAVAAALAGVAAWLVVSAFLPTPPRWAFRWWSRCATCRPVTA